jgi:hypothetical protein
MQVNGWETLLLPGAGSPQVLDARQQKVKSAQASHMVALEEGSAGQWAEY